MPQQAVKNKKKSLPRDAVQQQRQLQPVLLPMELPYPRLLKERRSTSSRHLKHQQSQHRLNILRVLLVRLARPTHRLKRQHGQRRLNALPARSTHRLKHQHGQRLNVPVAQPMCQPNAQAARPTHLPNVPVAQPMRLLLGPSVCLHPRHAIMAQIPNRGNDPGVPVHPTGAPADQQIQGTDPRTSRAAHSTVKAPIITGQRSSTRSIRPARQDSRAPLAGQVTVVAPMRKMGQHAQPATHVQLLVAPAATRDMVLAVPALDQPRQRNARKSDALLL